MIKWIDIGANLMDPVFKGVYRNKVKHVNDFDQMLERSVEHGMDKIMITGTTLEESLEAAELVKRYEGLYCTVGVHPTRCNAFLKDADGHINKLMEIFELFPEKVVAVGECGLDYDRLQFCEKDVQLKYFEKQLEMAEKVKLPMFLHNRNTDGDFVRLMKKYRHRIVGGVVHSFTGSLEEAKQILDLDLYIGINGCSLKTEENLTVVKSIPIERMMVETDAPWCDIRKTHASYKYVKTTFEMYKAEKFKTGCGVKGRNEPCHIRQVLEVLAEILNQDIHAVAKIVHDNTMKLFFN